MSMINRSPWRLLTSATLFFVSVASTYATDPSVAEQADSAGQSVRLTRTAGAGKSEVPPVVHSEVGDTSAGLPGRLSLRNVGKLQQYDWNNRSNFDSDIFSPKSVNFLPGGNKYYVNSLEGCRTVVYENGTNRKLKTIHHIFPSGRGERWAEPSGFYNFTHYPDGASRSFSGKPVEGAFSHGGRYLWVPYYRRTFDINAQDPSAVAVIDTRSDSIVRLFETGPLPKMVAVSADDRYVAITHWGDNTVGLIDVSDSDMGKWHHLEPLVAGSRLKLDFPLDKSVDRDTHSGLKLRGTVFTPDGRFLLVSAMGGPLQVFDLRKMEYVGRINSAYSVRHLVINNGKLYGSQNVAATVISVPLDSLESGIVTAIGKGNRDILVKGWRSCKVGGGARTIETSPDGKFLFVACNSASEVCVVDAETMTVADRIRVDSYPVGLAVSSDGSRMVVTSQGRKGFGGNAVNIFEIIRPDYTPVPETLAETVQTSEEDNGSETDRVEDTAVSDSGFWRDLWPAGGIILLVAGGIILICIALFRKRNK